MAHTTIDHDEHAVSIEVGAVVTKPVGRLRFTVERDEAQVVPGTRLHMSPGAPHSLVPKEPTAMLLTLLHARA